MMENNENNVQEQVKKVKKDVPKGNAAKGFVVAALLIVFLGIGFGFGFLCSKGWNPFATKASSKKIDESKPWVYDADYCINSEKKMAYGTNAGEEYNSKEDLKVPYVNINSDYAKKVNEEIKAIYDTEYNKYGNKSGEQSYKPEIKYAWFNTDKILSIAIQCRRGLSNTSFKGEYYIYNISLETLKEATYEDVYKECGFSSSENVREKAEIALLNAIDESEGVLDGISLKYDKYFIDKNGLNFFVPNAMGNPTPLVVTKDTTRVEAPKKMEETLNTTTAEKTQQESKQDFSFMKDAAFSNKIYETEKKDGELYYKVWFDGACNPTIYIERVGMQPYATYRRFYNIKSEGAAGSTYVTFEFKLENETLDGGKGEIKYSNVVGNDTIYLKLNAPLNEEYIELKERKLSQVTKEFMPSGWAGCSNNKVILYANGDVYYVGYNGGGYTDDCVLENELIAQNATDLVDIRQANSIEQVLIKGENLKAYYNAPEWVKYDK